MRTGFIYWHPFIYRGIVRFLYGRNFNSRYGAIASLLPNLSSVVDVCCGDCYLAKILAQKNIVYLGLDINPVFVKHALKRGINARCFDIKKETMPRGDYVIMQGSLYQFAPDHRSIMHKLFSAASKGVIISEPTRHASNSKNPLLSFFARRGTSVDGNGFPDRFAREELLLLFREFNVSAVLENDGGRDLIGFFKKEINGNYEAGNGTRD